MTRVQCIVLTISLAAVSSLQAQFTPAPTNAAAEMALAGTNDYSWLTGATMPPPGPMIDAALAALPKSLSDRTDWVARMRKAAWIPVVGLKYDIGQDAFRHYQNIPNGQRTTTTTQSQHQDSSQAGQSAMQSTKESQTQQSISSGSQDSYSTSYSVENDGPTSIALGDQAQWVNTYGIVLSWDLSRLVFRQEEMSVLRADIDKEQFRQNVRQQVIQTYYDLKEALLLMQSDTYKDSIPLRIRKERLAYLLDTLADGALSTRSGRKAP